MNRTATALLEQAGTYAHLFDRASVGGRFDDASSEGPIRLSSDQEVLTELAEISTLVRLAQAEQTRLAARSRAGPRTRTPLWRSGWVPRPPRTS